MVPGPVSTPGMRTTAFLSTAGEGDCCAATGAPQVTDVMTHTPIATRTLLIQFIICAHPPQKTNAGQYQFARPSLSKDDTMKQPKVDVDQGWRQGCATRAGRGWPRCRSRPPATGQMLLLLNGLKVIDDRANVLGREDELRHVRMAGGKALRQSLGKAFNLVFARERSEGRGRRVRAGAGAADGMAAGAIRRQQQLAASCGPGGLLCQDRPSHAHGDHHDEIIESLPAHMLFACSPGSAWPHRCDNKEQDRQPRFDVAQIRDAPARWTRYRIAQDGLESATFASSIPAIKAMRTRSERLAACILIMRLAR